MRCGRIAVEGEAEEIAVSPRPRSRQKHGKRSNPYSTSGLEKFENVCAELSTKREDIAKKTGVPETLVRFVGSKNGWTPVVLRPREGIGEKNSDAGAAGASILGPVEKNAGEEDGELRRKVEGNDNSGRSQRISISVFDERRQSLAIPVWSRFLKNTALRVLGVTEMWVRTSAAAAAMAMAVIGNVMYLKKFILNGISYFAALFKSPRAMKPKGMNDEHRHQDEHNSKAKIVRMDNDQPGTRPARPAQGFVSFYRRTSPAMAYDARVGATLMIITLLCLVFYGRLYVIFLWLYIFLTFRQNSERIRRMNSNNIKRMANLKPGSTGRR